MIRYCFRLIDTSNPTDVSFFEDLMTKSMADNAISIIKQETCFTKEGNYLIAVHYAEDGASQQESDKIRELIKDGGL